MQPARSYVLRCLPVPTGTEGDKVTWRFSLQEATPDSPRWAFGSLAELAAYLGAELGNEGAEPGRSREVTRVP